MGSLPASASPVQSGNTFVPLVALEFSAWHAGRLAVCRRIDRDLRRHSPEQARLAEPVPAEGGNGDGMDVDAADLDWWDRIVRSEWWADLARDDVADPYGDGPLYQLGDDDEFYEVDRFLRPRARSIAIDAEEEARAIYGWA